jgi:predicted secreted protein
VAAVHGKDSKFTFNSVELTTFIRDVSFPQSRDTAETSAMGTEAKTYVAGMSDATIDIEGMYDAAASGPDVTLAAAMAAGAAYAFIYRPNDATVSATNPEYTGSAICTAYDITGGIGDMVAFSASFQVTGAITRDVTP